ncbi:nicotinate phosphoribosyltransferase [Marinobacter koreensis]|uniref:Nicotinate phosphoribosyltransferase n=1 Tax=Marinobacter koreensis TaxID=335974 RepID=A0ABW0RIW8_9GAMM|nr:nicotinate phosphoribosyltransferase [Marinobacter koreensis]MCK7546790.1 nicotinate phosphoribosyltransferase [Marinobacter koreensis]
MMHQQDLPLLVDLYELAMAQAYWHEGMQDRAVFSLFFRDLPENRNFVLACGQRNIAEVLEGLRFSEDHIERLKQLNRFQPGFLEWLRSFRFSGSLHAVPEGTPLFPQEPLLEIEAPIAEAQILESLIMNYVHLESVLATKAVRLALAADGRPVVDFGLRRMHGIDAGHRSVRAFRLAGLSATSNVLAGLDFDMDVNGTMAHSFVQAYPDELEAFKVYARLYPGTTLLVDTYDSRRAVQRVVSWLREDPAAKIGAIRLDSGDLAAEARDCRRILDDGGFPEIRIMASGGLDEYRIARLLAEEAPIDGFGVGTAIGVAVDAPALELAYKLTEYAGEPKMKSSSGKVSFPGRKQVFRVLGDDGRIVRDTVAGRMEKAEGQPLLEPIMEDGRILPEVVGSLASQVDGAQQAIASLPDPLLGLEPAEPVPVQISDYLTQLQRDTLAVVAGQRR